MSNNESIADVAIVGLGTTGAALAGLLGRMGVHVVGFEKQPGLYELPRARMVDGEIMRIFQTLGVGEELEERFHLAPPFKFFSREGEVLLERDFGAGPRINGWPNSMMIHQPDIELTMDRVLRADPNVETFRGYSVEAVQDHGDHVGLSVRDDATNDLRTARARYVVGCEGGRSLVRRAIGGAYDVLGEDYDWCFVDVELRRPVDLPEHNFYILDPARPMAYLRNPRDYRRFYFRLLPGETEERMLAPDTLWELLAPWLKPGDARLIFATMFRFHSLLADRWRSGRMFIAGDAAHQMAPTMAQGMCSGMRDSANLAWKLADVLHGRANDSILDTYQSERIPHVRWLVEMSDKLAGWWSILDPTEADARDEMLRTLVIDPPDLRLGDGLHAPGDPLAGMPFPQDEQPAGRRLDDRVGPHFALIDPDGLVDQASSHARRLMELAQVVIVSEIGEMEADWLDRHGVRAVFVRPDRNVLGTAQRAGDFDAVLSRLPLVGNAGASVAAKS